MSTRRLPDGVQIGGSVGPEFDEILSGEALSFVAGLERAFRDTRAALLRRREERQTALRAALASLPAAAYPVTELTNSHLFNVRLGTVGWLLLGSAVAVALAEDLQGVAVACVV